MDHFQHTVPSDLRCASSPGTKESSVACCMANYLNRWMEQLKGQRLVLFEKLADTLLKHLEGIPNWNQVRFWVVEAVNGTIRMLINRGRGGYKNLHYLLLKAKRMAVTNVEFIAVHTVNKAA
jgi:hypothetical protein